MSRILFSIIESPTHPDFSAVYTSLGIDEVKIISQRKAIGMLKKQPPDFVVAEFFYGYGNNYAGVNVSNLDVFLHSLRKYAPLAKIIVLASPQEFSHVDKLTELFSIHAVLKLPATTQALQEALHSDTAIS